MALEFRQVDVPVGLEVAAHRLASVSKRDGCAKASVFAEDGVAKSMTFEMEGESHTVTFSDGCWREIVEVGEPDADV